MIGALAIRGLTKRFGAVAAVDDVSLDIRAGSLVALLGPSGCGKTTLLRCIAGLSITDAGEVLLDGASLAALPPWRRGLGMVFQSYALFPHLTVARNVAFGLRMRGVNGDAAAERVTRALALVRMEGFAERLPRQLSGGQQQRVALARALVTEPPVLLLDEPLSALDAKLRLAMRQELRELQRRLGITTIIVTHDQDEAMAMADDVAVMNHGRVEQVASPETVYRHPATPFVAEFVGRSNRIEGVVVAGGLQVEGLESPLPLPPDCSLAIGTPALAIIRPEQIILRSPGDSRPGEATLAGTITDLVFAGDHVEAYVTCGQLRLVAQVSTAAPIGTSVIAAWPSAATHIWRRQAIAT